MIKLLILDFVTSFGGVQRVMANVLPELSRLVEVNFVDALDNQRTRRILMDAGVQVLDLAVWPRVSALGYKNSMLQRLWWIVILGMPYLIYVLRVARFIRRRDIDVIYTNSKKGLVIGALIRLLVRKPLVYHVHGLFDGSSALFRWGLSQADAIIAVSEDVKRKLEAQELTGQHISVVYNAVDPDQLAEAVGGVSLHAIPGFRCLVACNLQPGKGVHIAVQAVNVLKERGLPVSLVIAGEVARGGDESYLYYLRALVDTLDLGDRVLFIGWQDRLPAVIAQCDIVLVPSIDDESFGMVSAEAMALGRPVIASRVGGLPEVVAHGRTGLLVEPGSVEELADGIATLYADRSLCARLGEAGREWVRDKFSVPNQAVAIRNVITSLVG